MTAKSEKYMTFLPGHYYVLPSHGCESVLEAGLKAGLDIDNTCGGSGTCGTCLVEVLKGLPEMDPRNEIEAELAQDRGLKPNERLSCQIKPQAGLTLKVPHKTDLRKSK